jgi:hypothetical protein
MHVTRPGCVAGNESGRGEDLPRQDACTTQILGFNYKCSSGRQRCSGRLTAFGDLALKGEVGRGRNYMVIRKLRRIHYANISNLPDFLKMN